MFLQKMFLPMHFLLKQGAVVVVIVWQLE